MERERTVVTGLLVLQLLLWLGFAVHRSPRFPGSPGGTALGVAGAALIVFPSLAYAAAKRLARLMRGRTTRLPLRRLLAWHVYGGIIGSVLGILHTGHRFESTLGIALTGAMLLSVFSGYVGRHYLVRVSSELREQQGLLERLGSAYNGLAEKLASRPRTAASAVSPWRLRSRPPVPGEASDAESFVLGYRAAELARSIADLEYDIKAQELLKRRFTVWLTVHVATTLAFYALLALHVAAGVYFGLRWLA
jgi:hypothetical protein